MKINLLDISEEGHEFSIKSKDEKAIDEKVADVVDGLKEFEFKVFIQKAGDIYTAQGTFLISQEQECSLCAEDISLPIQSKFTEFIVNETKADQKGHAPHSGLNVESKQEVTFVQHHELDMAEFISDMFAFAVSPYPKCMDQAACEKRQESNKKYYAQEKPKVNPAFSVLEKLKK
jgi:uncharacterized metal-binding protein YceD (DUF177 family)